MTELGKHLEAAREFLSQEKYKNFLESTYKFELISAKHTPAIVRWRSNPKNLELFLNRSKITEQDQENFLSGYEKRDRVDFVLIQVVDSIPVGTFSLTGLSGKPEIGKLLGEESFRGKGLAHSATRALISFAFDYLELPKLFATTRTDNHANIKLNEKLGFKSEGKKSSDGRQFLVMSLCRDAISSP